MTRHAKSDDVGVSGYITVVFFDEDRKRSRDRGRTEHIPLTIHMAPHLHRRLRLCPTLDFPPAAADRFISSPSNPASIRIRSTSSRIGLYSASLSREDPKSVHTQRTGVDWSPGNQAHHTALLQGRTRPFEEAFHGYCWRRTPFESSVHLGIRRDIRSRT